MSSMDMVRRMLELEKRIELLERGNKEFRYGVYAYNSATKSVATSTTTALTFDSTAYDDGSMHSTSVNTGRLTAPAAGRYLVGAEIEYQANATGMRQLYLRKNGSVAFASLLVATAPAATTTHLVVTSIAVLAEGDYVEAVTYQTSGRALNITAFGQGFEQSFWMERLTP